MAAPCLPTFYFLFSLPTRSILLKSKVILNSVRCGLIGHLFLDLFHIPILWYLDFRFLDILSEYAPSDFGM